MSSLLLHIQRYTLVTNALQFNLGIRLRHRHLSLDLLRALVHRPSALVISRLVDDNGNVTDQTLLQDTAEEANVEHGLVAADLGVLEDVERVDPVSGPASAGQVLDGVGDVWPKLDGVLSVDADGLRVKRAHLVDSDINVIWHEELTSVSHLTRDKGAVGQHVPLGVDSSVDVCKHERISRLCLDCTLWVAVAHG